MRKAAAKQKALYCPPHPRRLGEESRLKWQFWSLRSDNRKAKATPGQAAWQPPPQTEVPALAETPAWPWAPEKHCVTSRGLVHSFLSMGKRTLEKY